MRPLQNALAYKRKQVKGNDAVYLAKLDSMPQAFYLYKQRNDLLLDKLKPKEKEKPKGKLTKQTAAQMKEDQMT